MKYSVLLFLLSILILPSCAEENIQSAMATVDQAFIPTWISLKQNHSIEAQKYMTVLENEWAILKETDLAGWENEYYAPAIWEIDVLFQNALNALDKGNTWESYIALDRIRYKLVQFRQNHYIEYYLDYVWEFQMEHVDFNEIANDDVLCWLSWDNVERRSKELSRLWRRVEREKPDELIFQLSEQDVVRFEANRKAISLELENLQEIVACAERSQLAISSTKIGLHLNEVIQCFGDFELTGAGSFAIKTNSFQQ